MLDQGCMPQCSKHTMSATTIGLPYLHFHIPRFNQRLKSKIFFKQIPEISPKKNLNLPHAWNQSPSGKEGWLRYPGAFPMFLKVDLLMSKLTSGNSKVRPFTHQWSETENEGLWPSPGVTNRNSANPTTVSTLGKSSPVFLWPTNLQ